MNSRQNQGTLLMVGAMSSMVGIVAFVGFMLVGNYTVSPAAFLAILIALVVAVFLLVAFHKKPETPGMERTSAADSAVDPAPAQAHQADAATQQANPPAESPAAAPAPEPAEAPAAAPSYAAPDPAPEPAPEPAPAHANGEDRRPIAPDGKPELLSSARDGNPDDLKQIKGVGPKLEQTLHDMGVYHFDQIASWRAPEVAWVDEHLEGFKGRVSRDDWVSQARVLASGGTTDFSSKVKKGEVY